MQERKTVKKIEMRNSEREKERVKAGSDLDITKQMNPMREDDGERERVG